MSPIAILLVVLMVLIFGYFALSGTAVTLKGLAEGMILIGIIIVVVAIVLSVLQG